MRRRLTSLVVCASFLPATGCIGGWGVNEDQELGGPYHLSAIDVREQMSLVVCNKNGCSGHEKTNPTVIAAGINPNFVTFARHPADAFGEPLSPYRTEYYYITRSPDEQLGLSDKAIVGPISELEFKRRKVALGLPAFSVVFDDLR